MTDANNDYEKTTRKMLKSIWRTKWEKAKEEPRKTSKFYWRKKVKKVQLKSFWGSKAEDSWV